MTQQVKKFGAESVSDVIKEVSLDGDVKVLKSAKGEYQSKTIIIATGAHARPIGCKGEEEFLEEAFLTALLVMQTSSRILKYM